MSILNRFGWPIPFAALLAIGLMERGSLSSARAQSRSNSKAAISAEYKTNEIEGWTVYVKKDFLKAKPALADRTLTLLRLQLFQIARIVPSAAVKKLRTVRIWVEKNDPSTPILAIFWIGRSSSPRW